jgi:hypothetical protein
MVLRPMSQMGHSRRFDRAPETSGVHQLADIFSTRRHVSNVLLTEVAALIATYRAVGKSKVGPMR